MNRHCTPINLGDDIRYSECDGHWRCLCDRTMAERRAKLTPAERHAKLTTAIAAVETAIAALDEAGVPYDHRDEIEQALAALRRERLAVGHAPPPHT